MDIGLKPQALRDGTPTKALYIKHLSNEDWETLEQLKSSFDFKTFADVVRWAIKKAAGKI
jgi:hypothetical protein